MYRDITIPKFREQDKIRIKDYISIWKVRSKRYNNKIIKFVLPAGAFSHFSKEVYGNSEEIAKQRL